MSQNFIRPEYGNHLTQTREQLELCGLEDPADRFDPPAGPPVLIVAPVPVYPMDPNFAGPRPAVIGAVTSGVCSKGGRAAKCGPTTHVWPCGENF